MRKPSIMFKEASKIEGIMHQCTCKQFSEMDLQDDTIRTLNDELKEWAVFIRLTTRITEDNYFLTRALSIMRNTMTMLCEGDISAERAREIRNIAYSDLSNEGFK